MNFHEAFAALPWLFPLLITVLGLLVGSFLNVVIYRLPKMMNAEWQRECKLLLADETAETETPAQEAAFNLSWPASHCPSCEAAIGAHHNIPVISWLVLSGKCASCKAPISIRYPIIEALSGVLSLAAALSFGPTIATAATLILIWSLIALTFIDVDHQLLPDSITLPLMWVGLLFNASPFGWVSLQAAVFGAAGGYMVLWSVYWLFKLVTGKEGMGFGDFKLLAALGAFFGWTQLPLILILSSLVGAVTGITMMVLAGNGRSQPIPFGPYLAGAGVVCLFWGPQINAWYLGMSGING